MLSFHGNADPYFSMQKIKASIKTIKTQYKHVARFLFNITFITDTFLSKNKKATKKRRKERSYKNFKEDKLQCCRQSIETVNKPKKIVPNQCSGCYAYLRHFARGAWPSYRGGLGVWNTPPVKRGVRRPPPENI